MATNFVEKNGHWPPELLPNEFWSLRILGDHFYKLLQTEKSNVIFVTKLFLWKFDEIIDHDLDAISVKGHGFGKNLIYHDIRDIACHELTVILLNEDLLRIFLHQHSVSEHLLVTSGSIGKSQRVVDLTQSFENKTPRGTQLVAWVRGNFQQGLHTQNIFVIQFDILLKASLAVKSPHKSVTLHL